MQCYRCQAPPAHSTLSMHRWQRCIQDTRIMRYQLDRQMCAPGYVLTAELELKFKQAPLPKPSATPVCDTGLMSARKPHAATQSHSPRHSNKGSHWCSKALKFSKYLKSNTLLNTPNFILFQHFSSCQTLPGQPSTGDWVLTAPMASCCWKVTGLAGMTRGQGLP